MTFLITIFKTVGCIALVFFIGTIAGILTSFAGV
jgi:hypothetical protein